MSKKTSHKSSKKSRVLANQKKQVAPKWIYFLILVSIPITVILIMASGSKKENSQNNQSNTRRETVREFNNQYANHKELKAVNGKVQLPTKQFKDGVARYYKLKTSKGYIYFFALMSSDGIIRAAFDACDVCFRSKMGYRQEGNFMVCNNCGRAFESTLINVEEGGCNPAPLKRKLKDGMLEFQVDDIQSGYTYFI